MKKLSKEEILTSIAVALLLFTAMIDWSVSSLLILLSVIIILFVWYSKKK